METKLIYNNKGNNIFAVANERVIDQLSHPDPVSVAEDLAKHNKQYAGGTLRHVPKSHVKFSTLTKIVNDKGIVLAEYLAPQDELGRRVIPADAVAPKLFNELRDIIAVLITYKTIEIIVKELAHIAILQNGEATEERAGQYGTLYEQLSERINHLTPGLTTADKCAAINLLIAKYVLWL